MATRRPPGAVRAPVPTNPVTGSVFDEDAGAPTVILPKGLTPTERAACKRVLASAIHLQQCQADQIVRYVRLQAVHAGLLEAFDAVEATSKEGLNLLTKIAQISSALATLERNLALTNRSIAETVDRSIRTKQAELDRSRNQSKPGKSATVRKLQLA